MRYDMRFLPSKRLSLFDYKTIPIGDSDFLHSVLEATSDAVFVKSVDGKYRFVNSVAERVINVPVGDIIGRLDDDFFPKDVASRIKEVDSRVFKTGLLENLNEYVPDPDGTTHTWSTTKYPLKDKGGLIVGLLGISRDITQELRNKTITERLIKEQKEQIKELDHIAKDLVRRDMELSRVRAIQEGQIVQLKRVTRMLVRRDSELTQAKERLEHLNREKSEFISIAAHQLRTPLTCIKWPLTVLARRFGDKGFTKKGKVLLSQALESTERMILLVNDFLNVVRMEEKHFSQNVDRHNLREFIGSISSRFEGRASERDIEFSIEISKSVPQENAFDRERITVALENILDNAFKYSNVNGRVSLSLELKDKNTLLFSVSDDGIGVPSSENYKIFQKFSRASNALLHEGGNGSGLGLFLVKGIVNVAGGDVWFESVEKEGTTFYFTLPIINK